MLLTITFSLFVGIFANVACQKGSDGSSPAEGAAVAYLIPVFGPVRLDGGDNDNKIDEGRLLPLQKLILALAPSKEATNKAVPHDGLEETRAVIAEERKKRSPSKCNKCGYSPQGGKGGGSSGSWSQASASASSGSYGSGGGGGKYGRK